MADLILYNYPMSPYSEKIRLMLGYTGLPWRSVIVAAMPPRPELKILTGGYRKIPVAQIGADVFCDTQTITSEIARLTGKPELALENCSEEVQTFVRKADNEMFMTFILTAGSGLVTGLVRNTSLLETLKFFKDRIGIGLKAKIKPAVGKQATAKIRAYLSDMDALLTADFLFGNQPCIADFSAYYSLWLACDFAGKPWLDNHPRIAAWYSRMTAFGQGEPEALSAGQALDIARAAEPASPETAVITPESVSIAPRDYARDPVAGLLVSESEGAWVLQRHHPKVGTVHVHFPKYGYELQPAQT